MKVIKEVLDFRTEIADVVDNGDDFVVKSMIMQKYGIIPPRLTPQEKEIIRNESNA